MKKIIFIISLFSATILSGQENILNRPDILNKVEKCLYSTYGYHFTEAKKYQSQLEVILPTHPAPYFLKALIIYWENFPLLPDDSLVADFETAINKTIEYSKAMIKSREGNMEGVFFDTHARAYRSMFWADNGKPVKVIHDLDNMYRNTMKGIEFKQVFHEFYFSSGLYNYYVEAYVEKHPVYKPVALLFKKGNKKQGLEELTYAIQSTTFIKYEALRFMSLIQLNFEQDLTSATNYASILYNYFPDNSYYLGQYLIILLHNKNYYIASLLSSKLTNRTDGFTQMVNFLCKGFLEENQQHKLTNAREYYLKSIAIGEKYGTIADVYIAIAYAGLSRIAKERNNEPAFRKYRRLSLRHSKYEYILDF